MFPYIINIITKNMAKFSFSHLKDYIYIGGIIIAIALPHIKSKLGIDGIEKNQSDIQIQMQENQNKIMDNLKSLKKVNCDNIILLKGILRLQNETSNSNELIFAKMKVDALEVSMARSRNAEIRKEVLEDLKAFSAENECLF